MIKIWSLAELATRTKCS